MDKAAIQARRDALLTDLRRAQQQRQQAEADERANRELCIAINGAIQDCDFWLAEIDKPETPGLKLVEHGA